MGIPIFAHYSIVAKLTQRRSHQRKDKRHKNQIKRQTDKQHASVTSVYISIKQTNKQHASVTTIYISINQANKQHASVTTIYIFQWCSQDKHTTTRQAIIRDENRTKLMRHHTITYNTTGLFPDSRSFHITTSFWSLVRTYCVVVICLSIQSIIYQSRLVPY